MKGKSTQELVQKFIAQIFSAETLKEISDTLEQLSQDQHFKTHASAIVNDIKLTGRQKRSQLSYLLSHAEAVALDKFVEEEIGTKHLWLFSAEKVDYFDNFAQQFQIATENIGVVQLTSAVDLSQAEIKKMSTSLSKEFGYKVIINHEVNRSIVGGVKIKVENMVFDYSVKTKFQQFQRQWLNSLAQTDKLIGGHET